MPNEPTGDERRREQGVALVSSLWVILLLSMIAGSMMLSARSEIRTTGAIEQRAIAEAIADAGVAQAVLNLTDTRPNRRWTLSAGPRNVSFTGHAVSIVIEDEFGKIDLNRADPALLRALFGLVTDGPELADTLADAVADWRDPDDLHRLNGAEAKDYELAGLDYGPANAPFDVVDELGLVIGMTQEFLNCLKPALTVYSGRRMPDVRTAPTQVSALMGLAREASGTPPRRAGGREGRIGALGGRALTIRAEARAGENVAFTREAVIRITGNPRKPFWVHAWGQKGSTGGSTVSCIQTGAQEADDV